MWIILNEKTEDRIPALTGFSFVSEYETSKIKIDSEIFTKWPVAKHKVWRPFAGGPFGVTLLGPSPFLLTRKTPNLPSRSSKVITVSSRRLTPHTRLRGGHWPLPPTPCSSTNYDSPSFPPDWGLWTVIPPTPRAPSRARVVPTGPMAASRPNLHPVEKHSARQHVVRRRDCAQCVKYTPYVVFN